jgi:hypothetical protein
VSHGQGNSAKASSYEGFLISGGNRGKPKPAAAMVASMVHVTVQKQQAGYVSQ